VTTPAETRCVLRDPAYPNTWRCPDEPAATVDTAAVSDLLAAAARIEAGRFMAFMPPDLSAYGLDSPTASVTFGFRADEGIQNTLLLGNAADDAWRHAMIQGHDFVFLLAEAKAASLRQPLCIAPPPPADSAPTGTATDAAPDKDVTE